MTSLQDTQAPEHAKTAATVFVETAENFSQITFPVFLKVGGVWHTYELRLQDVSQQPGLEKWEAKAIAGGATIFEEAAFGTLQAIMAAALAKISADTLGTTSPQAITFYALGTGINAELASEAGDIAQDVLTRSAQVPGILDFISQRQWQGEGQGEAGNLIFILGNKVLHHVFEPLPELTDITLEQVFPGLNFLDYSKAIFNIFPTMFFGPQEDFLTVRIASAQDQVTGYIGRNVSETFVVTSEIAQAIENGWLVASGGDDIIVVGTGQISMEGGEGRDRIDYSPVDQGVGVFLNEGGTHWLSDLLGGNLQAKDIFSSIEDVIGSVYADSIEGSNEANSIAGGEGRDTLSGGVGQDTISGDGNNDVIWGADGVTEPAGSTYTAVDYGMDDLVGDVLIGGAGADTIFAGLGDTVYGDDSASGGTSGGDVIYAYNATSVFGGGGDDTIYAYYDLDDLTGVSIDGGGGNDKIYVMSTGPTSYQIATIYLGTGSDTVVAGGDGWRITNWLGGPYDLEPDAYIMQPGVYAMMFTARGTLHIGNQSVTGLVIDGDGAVAGGSDVGDMGGGYTIMSMYYGDLEEETRPDIIQKDSETYIEWKRSGQVSYQGGLLGLGVIPDEDWTMDGRVHNPIYTPSAHVDSHTQELDALIAAYASAPPSGNNGTSGNDAQQGTASNELMRGYGGNDTQLGGAGNDTLQGDEGNDSLTGGEGADSVLGGADNDTIVGTAGDGSDAYDGGAGSEDWLHLTTLTLGITINLTTGVATGSEIGTDTLLNIENVRGGSGNDTITGSAVANKLEGKAGNDSILGAAGNDTIWADDGNDYANGGADNDTLYGWLGNDTLLGDSGDDFIGGDDGADVLEGGNGADTLFGWHGNDSLIGGSGADTLSGENNNDSIEGGAGGDSIVGGAGVDLLSYLTSTAGVSVNLKVGGFIAGGDAAGDTVSGMEDVTGSGFADTLTGDAIGNKLYGNAGNDTLNGGEDNAATTVEGADTGNDSLYGGDGNDVLDGKDGNDWVYGDGDNDTVRGGTGNDTVYGGTGADSINGQSGDDHLYGMAGGDGSNNTGNDTIFGGDGNDVVTGSGGQDSVNGEGGNDYVDGKDGDDTVYGGAGLDSVYGGIGSDLVYAGADDDYVSGQGGDDIIYGQTGADVLSGGLGLDRFVFETTAESSPSSTDRITDFSRADDLIDLSLISGINSFSDLVVTLNGADTEITYSTSFKLVLTGDYSQGVNLLTSADFIF